MTENQLLSQLKCIVINIKSSVDGFNTVLPTIKEIMINNRKRREGESSCKKKSIAKEYGRKAHSTQRNQKK